MKPLQALLRQSTLSAFLAAAGFHVLVIIGTAATTTFRDAFVFTLVLGVLAFFGLLGLNILGFGIRRWIPTYFRACAPLWNSFAIVGGLATLTTVVLLRPFWPGFLSHTLAVIFALALSALVVRTCVHIESIRFWLAGQKHLGVGVFILLLIPSVLAPALQPHRPAFDISSIQVDPGEGERIMFIGVDGATFDVIDPLIAAGRLPNFKKIIEGGVRAPLQSEPAANQPMANSASKGMRTPVIWETIYTGHHPKNHRVWDFMSTRISGIGKNLPFRLPLPRFLLRMGFYEFDTTYSTDGQERRFWELYEDFGWEAMVLGLVDTWPAFRQGNATVVSDRTHRNDRFLCYPESLDEEIGWFYNRFPEFAKREGLEFNPNYRKLFHPELDKEEFDRHHQVYRNMRSIKDRVMEAKEYPEFAMEYFSFSFDPNFRTKWTKQDPEYWENHLIKNQCSEISRDKFYFEISMELLNERKSKGLPYPKLTAFYYSTTDTAQHWFWKYFEPDAFSFVPKESIARCADVIPQTYEMVDGWLGEILKHVDDKTTIVICSDHGAGAWTEQEGFGLVSALTKLAGTGDHQDYSGNHRTNGVLIVNGPGIRKGAKIEDRSIYDVAPLILHLSGLPTSEAMRGTVPTEVFEKDYLSLNPVRFISDYGPRKLPQNALDLTGIINSNDDGEIFDRLKELGYI